MATYVQGRKSGVSRKDAFRHTRRPTLSDQAAILDRRYATVQTGAARPSEDMQTRQRTRRGESDSRSSMYDSIASSGPDGRIIYDCRTSTPLTRLSGGKLQGGGCAHHEILDSSSLGKHCHPELKGEGGRFHQAAGRKHRARLDGFTSGLVDLDERSSVQSARLQCVIFHSSMSWNVNPRLIRQYHAMPYVCSKAQTSRCQLDCLCHPH
nr:hypothetical protein CFP56_21971 [Quercus suber]